MCLDELDRSDRIILEGNINVKVGDQRTEGVMGEWEVPGAICNENALMDLRVGKRLKILNI